MQFGRHYTRDEARALLPRIREWFDELDQLRAIIHEQDQRISHLLEQHRDAGGEPVQAWLHAVAQTKDVFRQFQRREIQVKDLDRGLIDFPAILNGREVFLCWEKDEDDIEFWHDLETGYAGRTPF